MGSNTRHYIISYEASRYAAAQRPVGSHAGGNDSDDAVDDCGDKDVDKDVDHGGDSLAGSGYGMCLIIRVLSLSGASVSRRDNYSPCAQELA